MANKKRSYLCIFSLMLLAEIPIAKADLLRDGREAFMNYDFERASELYTKYSQSLKKNPNEESEKLLEMFNRQLEIAENSLDNVQRIEVIDRIDVPKEAFFKYIKLPAYGGKLMSSDMPALKGRHNDSDFVFATEDKDFMLWTELDDNSKGSLMQSELLLDGTWEPAMKVGENLNDGGDVKNPFMLTDGITLYFAGNGDGSMGGYDIFVATKDPVSGEFRQPIGVGYPFNSPYNEYLMAIDEENGIGWWVTDRNELDGQVSVYIYKTNEIRSNYQDEEDVVPYARLQDISITQNPNTDYGNILKDIEARSRNNVSSKASDFLFYLPNGRIARSISDFSSATARKNMGQYLKANDEYNSEIQKLSSLRKQYHKSDKKSGVSASLKNQILDLEKKLEFQSESLKKMRNAIIGAETR